MAGRIRRFVCAEGGATAIEYALIGGLIALAVVSGVSSIGLKLSGYFSQVSAAIK